MGGKLPRIFAQYYPSFPHQPPSRVPKAPAFIAALSVVAAAVYLLDGGTAFAQTFTLSPTTVAPGGTINVSGDGCFSTAAVPVTISVSPSINNLQTNISLNAATGVWS